MWSIAAKASSVHQWQHLPGGGVMVPAGAAQSMRPGLLGAFLREVLKSAAAEGGFVDDKRF
jgi:hypothetical protein